MSDTPAAVAAAPPPPPAAAVVSQEGLRAQARTVYRQSLDAELPINGRVLGEMFARSDRWGRERIQEVRAQLVGPGGEKREQSGKRKEPTWFGAIRSEPTDVPTWPTSPAPETPAPTVEATGHHAGTDQPAGARAVIWAAFLLGIAASLAANVAHAQPATGPRLAAGFVPLALLLAVECMTRPRWNRDGWLWGLARYGGTGLVAVVAGVMSYRHMHGLLLAYGEDPLTAGLGPLAVDGLMIVSGFALLATAPRNNSSRQRRG